MAMFNLGIGILRMKISIHIKDYSVPDINNLSIGKSGIFINNMIKTKKKCLSIAASKLVKQSIFFSIPLCRR